MKHPLRITTAVVLASALSACEREAETTAVAPTPAPMAQSAAPDTSTTATTTTAATSTATSADAGQSMERLQSSAQRLRDAIQAMAQEPAGDRRNKAIKEAHQALFDTNEAMVQLVPETRTAGAIGSTSSQAASGSAGNVVYPESDAEYTRAMEQLQKAAQQLRESIQAMAQKSGADRDTAIKQAHQALLDTQQAMIQLPPDMRTEKK